MSSRKDQKLQARAERLAREAKLQADARRRALVLRASAAVAGLAAVGAAGIAIASGGGGPPRAQGFSTPVLSLASLARLGPLRSPGSPGPLGPESLPVPAGPDLASSDSGAPVSPVDGIQCLGSEQLLFHIHAHLTVYVNGAARRIPQGIGIAGAQTSQTPVGAYVGSGSCFYWLHTHAADGIIHIESPIQRTYTLGDFFDVWGQKLGPDRVGPVTGPVMAIYDGRLYQGNPRNIPLNAHAQIQLEVGRPLVAPVAISFPAGL